MEHDVNMTVKKFLLKRSHLLRTFNSGGGGWGRGGLAPVLEHLQEKLMRLPFKNNSWKQYHCGISIEIYMQYILRKERVHWRHYGRMGKKAIAKQCCKQIIEIIQTNGSSFSLNKTSFEFGNAIWGKQSNKSFHNNSKLTFLKYLAFRIPFKVLHF